MYIYIHTHWMDCGPEGNKSIITKLRPVLDHKPEAHP